MKSQAYRGKRGKKKRSRILKRELQAFGLHDHVDRKGTHWREPSSVHGKREDRSLREDY